MSQSELDELTEHINSKLSKVKNLIHLRDIGNDPEKHKIFSRIAEEVIGLAPMLSEFEVRVAEERASLKRLQELHALVEEDLQDAIHMSENVPRNLPLQATTAREEQKENEAPSVKEQPAAVGAKKSRKPIKEMEFITVHEFDAIPAYMKGRVTYDQLNSAVRSFNKAVSEKYKILHQPPRTLNNHSRKLYDRFKENETGETRGHFFVVEADLREFGEVTMDKRFLNLLSMLRHCQRIKELRGGRLIRYQLL